jgi:hypothetical protein
LISPAHRSTLRTMEQLCDVAHRLSEKPFSLREVVLEFECRADMLRVDLEQVDLHTSRDILMLEKDVYMRHRKRLEDIEEVDDMQFELQRERERLIIARCLRKTHGETTTLRHVRMEEWDDLFDRILPTDRIERLSTLYEHRLLFASAAVVSSYVDDILANDDAQGPAFSLLAMSNGRYGKDPKELITETVGEAILQVLVPDEEVIQPRPRAPCLHVTEVPKDGA